MALKIDPRLVLVAIQEGPAIIAALKSAFSKAHPDVPAPTSEEVVAAYEALFTSDLATDDAWLSAHPRPTP